MECGTPQSASPSDNGSDPSPFTAAKYPAQQRPGARPDHRMNDAFPAPPPGLNRAFHVDLFAGRRMVKLNNLGVNPRALTVGHYQAVEPKHHAGAAFDLAGHINLRDVSVHTCIPVFAR